MTPASSTRIAPTPGSRPSTVYTVQPRLWRSDIHRRRLEPLELAKPTRATISFDVAQLHQRQLSIDILNPDALTVPGDFVAPDLVLTDGYGREATLPLGHFMVSDPRITRDGVTRAMTLKGWDITYFLEMATLPNGLLLDDGLTMDTGRMATFLAVVRGGLPADRVDIPDSGVVLGRDIWLSPGTTILAAINALMAAGGMYPVWTDGEGVLTSRRITAAPRPAMTYGTDSGAWLVPPVTEEQRIEALVNRVTVYQESPGKPTITQTATVTDGASPLHPDRLAERFGSSTPIYRAERVQASQLPEDPVTANIVALLLAVKELTERASYERTATLETFVDSALGAHDAIGLDIREGDDVLGGTWLQRRWSVELRGARATVNRTLGRYEALATPALPGGAP